MTGLDAHKIIVENDNYVKTIYKIMDKIAEPNATTKSYEQTVLERMIIKLHDESDELWIKLSEMKFEE